MKKNRYPYIFLLLDILLVVIAFLFAAKVKEGTRRILADFQWWRSLFAFTGIWIGVSILGGKYSLQKVGKASKLASQIVKCDLYCDSGSFCFDVYIQSVSVFQDDSIGDDFRECSAGVICFWWNILCLSV